MKESNRSSQQHRPWKLHAFYSVLRVKKTLISSVDVSRAHFYADAVRDVYIRLPDEDPKAKQPGVWEVAKDDVRIFGCCPMVGRTLCSGFENKRIFQRRGFSVPLLP